MNIRHMLTEGVRAKNTSIGGVADSYFRYIDADGNPALKRSYCVFLDVLGFADRMTESYKLGKKNDLFLEFYNATKVELDRILGKPGRTLGVIHRIFSDNILIGIPLHSDDGEAEFWAMTNIILDYQLEMSLRGFFLRGGFVLGDLFVDDDVIYGEALLESVKIEANLAVVPRVRLSTSALRNIRSHLEFYENTAAVNQYDQVYINFDGSGDGVGFINYLERLVSGNVVACEKLLQHRNQVMRATSRYRHLPRVAYKYLWLCKYHNYFCSTIKSDSFCIDKYLIPSDTYADIGVDPSVVGAGLSSEEVECMFGFGRM